MVRPLKSIDWDKVDELLEAGCQGTEIAAYIGMHPNTFYDRCKLEKKIGFTEYSQEKIAKGNTILRKTQFNVATKDKNIVMLVWLGKQRLGQKEPEKEKETLNLEAIIKALGGFVSYANSTAASNSHNNQAEQAKAD